MIETELTEALPPSEEPPDSFEVSTIAPPPPVRTATMQEFVPPAQMPSTGVPAPAPEGSTAAGVISVVFGSLAAICVFFACILSVLTVWAGGLGGAIPFFIASILGFIGLLVGRLGRGGLRVIGVSLNLLALVPAVIMAGIFLGCLGILGIGVMSAPSSQEVAAKKATNPSHTAEAPRVTRVDEEARERERTRRARAEHEKAEREKARLAAEERERQRLAQEKAKREGDERAAMRAKGAAALGLMLSDKDRTTRAKAALALDELGAAAAEAVPALGEALKDDDPVVRREVAKSLGQVGPPARKALAALLADENDSDPEAKQSVAFALAKLFPLMKDDLPAVLVGLKSDDPAVRRRRCQLLADMGQAAAGAVKELTAAVADVDAGVRAAAIGALGDIGSRAKDAAPVLIKATADPEAKVRVAAVFALKNIDAGEVAFPSWLVALKDKDEHVAAAAGTALQDSKLNKEHVAPLAEVAKGAPTAEGRRYAVAVLAGLGGQSTDAAKAVGQALEDEDKAVRMEAIQGLGKLKGAGWRAVPELGKLARGKDAELQKLAVVTLGKIGPKAKGAVPDLIEVLHGGELHDEAAAALVKIGSGAVSGLVAAMDETKDFKQRIELINLLGEIGPDASDAIKPLEKVAAGGKLPGLKAAARNALAKIKRK